VATTVFHARWSRSPTKEPDNGATARAYSRCMASLCWLPSLRSSVSLYSPGVETRRSGTNRLGSGSVVLLAISAFLCEQPTYKSLAALELDLLVVELLRDRLWALGDSVCERVDLGEHPL